MSYVRELRGDVRDVVLDAYIDSFEYTHCE